MRDGGGTVNGERLTVSGDGLRAAHSSRAMRKRGESRASSAAATSTYFPRRSAVKVRKR